MGQPKPAKPAISAHPTTTCSMEQPESRDYARVAQLEDWCVTGLVGRKAEPLQCSSREIASCRLWFEPFQAPNDP